MGRDPDVGGVERVMIRGEHHEIDGSIVYVEVAGEGAPVLCIHSAGQSGVQWRPVLRRLPQLGYQVIVVDLPGHGRSDNALAGPVTDLSAYTQLLIEVMQRVGAVDPFVVGCSIGGKIALEVALADALPPRAVVVMAADAFNRKLSLAGLTRAMEDAASPSRSDRTFFGTIAAVGRGVDEDRARAIAAMHRREDPVVSTADLIAWTTHDLRERLPRVRCPVRYVVGADDFWVDVADSRWAAAQIPRCVYEELPGVGHYPMEEIEGFPDLLDVWLRELVSG